MNNDMTPWTARERALYEALEYCAHYLHAIRKAVPDPIYVDTLGEWCATHPSEEHLEFSRHDTEASVSAALADQPPPDPRDEALRLAEAELLRLWKLVPAGRAGVGGVRTIALEDDEVARLRQIVDVIRAAKETR